MKPETLKTELPAALGYRMPAEWHPHKATWLSWPHNPITWPDHRLQTVRDGYLTMIAALLPGERVNLLLADPAEKERIVRHLTSKGANLDALVFHDIQTVDAWIRDYGPTFLLDSKGGAAFCKWIFNAWGGKYCDLMQDTEIFNRPLAAGRRFEAGFVLEGGSIEVNGAGTCMTTEQCLLNPNRNPQFSRAQLEQHLRDYLGVRHIVWLGEGIVGDDTDGHIDDIARFVNETTILAAYEDDSDDANYEILKENWERLEQARDQDGRPWNLVKLPMPAKVEDEGVRLPASYANFYIGNSVVLLPVFNDPKDSLAVRIVADLFPGRKVVPVLCRDMVYGLGAIHCVSQQEP